MEIAVTEMGLGEENEEGEHEGYEYRRPLTHDRRPCRGGKVKAGPKCKHLKKECDEKMAAARQRIRDGESREQATEIPCPKLP